MVLGRTIYVFIKLLPSILALRKDRVLWISDDKKDVDEERFKRHARRILKHMHLARSCLHKIWTMAIIKS